MNLIDQAFIRAYQTDSEATAPPSIAMQPLAHAPVAPAPKEGQAQPSTQPLPPSPHLPPASGPKPSPSSGQRRPLSAFALKGPTVESHFKPALEVDGFRWPLACESLVLRHRERLRPALMTVLAADEAGRSLIGIGGPAAGMGCTTLLACLARLLVEAGKTVALVDGNFAAPGLARHFGLEAAVGWEEVLAGNAPLAEAVVYSLADRMALLPLVSGGAAAASGLDTIHASVTAGVLRYHYDVVLFDLGAVTQPSQGATARRIARSCRIDGVILTSAVADSTALQPQRLMQAAPELAAVCLGVVENQTRAA